MYDMLCEHPCCLANMVNLRGMQGVCWLGTSCACAFTCLHVAMAVLRQARLCAGGVAHLAAATPNTVDDLDALLGLR